MTNTKYPLATWIGASVELSLVVVADPVERELYNTTRFVVNEAALKAELLGAGYYKVNKGAMTAATVEVEARLASIH